MTLSIRPAVPGDGALVHRFVVELAEYERLTHEVMSSPQSFERDLFCLQPRIFCDIADWSGEPVGFALWYYTFSTFQGQHGIWLEDLYVRSQQRGRGIGKALLKHLAARCLAEGLGRLEWNVLDWNQPSIDFYLSQGGVILDDWQRVRVHGDALQSLGTP